MKAERGRVTSHDASRLNYCIQTQSRVMESVMRRLSKCDGCIIEESAVRHDERAILL